MGKHQPLEQLLEELAVFEATVNDWDAASAPQTPPDISPIPVLMP
jgi:hypothetical protein